MMPAAMRKACLVCFLLLLLVSFSLRTADRAAAKGLGVEPHVGSPGTEVRLTSFFPGAAPEQAVEVVLTPQSPPAACSAVLAEERGKAAPGVDPASWELSATATIPDRLTCADGTSVPVAPGMYWIEARGVVVEGRSDFPEDLLRVPFGVPEFAGGTLGGGFLARVALDLATVKMLQERFPGRATSQEGIVHQRGAPLIVTLICPAGCDGLAGYPASAYPAKLLQTFYYPYLDVDGGLIAFDPGGTLYSLDQKLAQALNRPVGLTPERRREQLTQSAPPLVESRDWTPYVVVSVAGGLAFAAGAFGAGVALARLTRRVASSADR